MSLVAAIVWLVAVVKLVAVVWLVAAMVLLVVVVMLVAVVVVVVASDLYFCSAEAVKKSMHICLLSNSFQ